MTEPDKAGPRSPLSTAFGALIGLRRRTDFERDAAGLKPKQLIIVALALVTMFVGGIITIVHFVLH
jgi:hypothetical protein